MKITICGSMQFDTEMQQAKADLEKPGYEVEKPNAVEGHVYRQPRCKRRPKARFL